MDVPKYSNLDKPLADIEKINRVFSANELFVLKLYGIITIQDFIDKSEFYFYSSNNFDDIFGFLNKNILKTRLGVYRLINIFFIFKKEAKWSLIISEKTRYYLLRPCDIKTYEKYINNIGFSVEEVINEIGFLKKNPVQNIDFFSKELINIKNNNKVYRELIKKNIFSVEQFIKRNNQLFDQFNNESIFTLILKGVSYNITTELILRVIFSIYNNTGKFCLLINNLDLKRYLSQYDLKKHNFLYLCDEYGILPNDFLNHYSIEYNEVVYTPLLDFEEIKKIPGNSRFLKAGVKTIENILEINNKEVKESNAQRDFFFVISEYLNCGPITILKLICLLYAQGHGFMQISIYSKSRINRSLVLKNINLLEKYGIDFNTFAEHYKLKSKSK
jgi:hypothetical protein